MELWCRCRFAMWESLIGILRTMVISLILTKSPCHPLAWIIRYRSFLICCPNTSVVAATIPLPAFIHLSNAYLGSSFQVANLPILMLETSSIMSLDCISHSFGQQIYTRLAQLTRQHTDDRKCVTSTGTY